MKHLIKVSVAIPIVFTITSNSITRTILYRKFFVRYRMNSTKDGLYVVDLGSDDGSRLTVDGTLLYNNGLTRHSQLKQVF